MAAPSYDKLVNRPGITDAIASAFANPTAEVPDQYIRSEEIHDAVVVGEESYQQLPLVDMARLLDPESSALEIAKLGAACRDWGFFQLTNHGVDETAIQQMKDSTVQFFSLPLEVKKTVATRDSGFEGFGHHYSRANDKLDWAESVILITQQPHDRNLEFWPTKPPTFRDALEEYSVEMTNLAKKLLRFMAADLGVPEEALQDAFQGKRQSMAIHYYPPCRHPEVIGITPHTDGLGLTLLLHVDDTPGLQIRKDDGRWFPVRPLPGSLVINIGDILEALTNGMYRSVPHRVLPDAERGRTTVVFFQEASVGGMLAPLPELLGEGRDARYRSVTLEEYIQGNFGALAQGTRFLDTLKI